MERLARAREEVEEAFRAAMAVAEARQAMVFAVVERELWTKVLALGRALVVLFLAGQAARPRATEYQHGRATYQVDGERTTQLGTLFGKVPFTRPIGRLKGAVRAAADLPVDRELALCAGFSLGVVFATARLCAQMAFASARDNFGQTHEWAPSPRAILRMVDAVGAEARAFLESAMPPEGDGEILVIQVDGKGAPMINSAEYAKRTRPHEARSGTKRKARRLRRRGRTKKRRAPGKKSKNAKVAVVGVLYTLARTPEGIEGPIGKRMVATFESHEALFFWLAREAAKRGYGKKRTLFIADGAKVIWNLQKKYFPLAEECIDWCHVVEKLWRAGECIFGEASEELKDWMSHQERRLRNGAAKAILQDLRDELAKTPKTGPGNRGKRKRLRQAIRYFRTHKRRMPYARLRKDDLDIGSGVVEGAVRNLVGMRTDGPGMRWSQQRAEYVIHLRCVLLNGQWADFESFLARKRVALKAKPQHGTPHDAVRKAA